MGSVVGIGVDITETEKVYKAIQKESFLRRCYTNKEQELIKKRKSSAVCNFAGKEAVAKALGTGFSKFWPADVEVLRMENGKPYINLYGKAKETADELGITKIHISLSDIKEMAVAYVVAERED
ncbi:MAG TPA: holo-[acyl-carrier-protein] synthase [Lachnospiraceae bacterium]|nr:holo-[acyl-carrier-protein] synthase [Lachnospiraceae bacterium]